MVRGLEFDVCEMAFTTYLCAKAHGKPFTGHEHAAMMASPTLPWWRAPSWLAVRRSVR